MKKYAIPQVKKILILFSSIFIVFVFILNLNLNQKITDDYENFSKPIVFTNDFFNSTLTEPNVLPVHDVISMSEIYDYMLLHLVPTSKDNLSTAQINNLDALDQQIANHILDITTNKWVSISNADELYHFGNAQSINFNQQAGVNTYIYMNTIEAVLSLNYILLSDIDYSVKRAQKFVPIGTNILLDSSVIGSSDNISLYMPFTGTFDGNGFIISNLYLADFTYITTTFTDDDGSTAVTVSLFREYGMFAAIGENGTVKNFILKNPIYEVLMVDSSNGLFSFSMFAGDNRGRIYNVGVIDQKINRLGQDNTGLIVNVRYPSSESYNAAAFVYKNSGEVYNSYVVTNNIVQTASIFLFDVAAPFVYDNSNGLIDGAAYVDSVISFKPSSFTFYNGQGLASYPEAQLKSGTGININSVDLSNLINNSFERHKWFFYELDGYPRFEGLNFENNAYEIYDEYDFVIFSRMINLITPKNGKLMDQHTYILKNHINMINITGYETPKRDFRGILTGSENEIDFDIDNPLLENSNKYIFNLVIRKPYIIGSNYYIGMLGLLSGQVRNINFYKNEVYVSESDLHFGKSIFVGMIAGRSSSTSVIRNIINASNIDLGQESIGTVFAGGIVGSGSGSIVNVANTKVADFGYLNGNTHNFNNRTVIPNFYLGGIIGRNHNHITIHNVMNEVNVTGISSLNDNTNYIGQVNSYTGGIIGELNNTTINGSSLKHITNSGDIKASNVPGKQDSDAHHFTGGIFGSIRGFGFKLNDGNQIRNGRLENKGTIKGEYVNTNTFSYLAGIGVVNTNQENSEVSYVVNSAGFEIEGLDYRTNNNYIYYAATVVDNTLNGMTLSRAYNTEDFIYNHDFFTSNNTDIENDTEIITTNFSEKYNFHLAGYTANPSGVNPESNNGNVFGTVSKVTDGYRFASGSTTNNVEIRNLNLNRSFKLVFEVTRSANNINLQIEFVGSGQAPTTISNISNGLHEIDLDNITNMNMVELIRFRRPTSTTGTLDLKAVLIVQKDEPKDPSDSIEISNFFTSVNQAPSKLKYVENKGDLTVGSSIHTSVVGKYLKISNITQATRIDYFNVINSGNITVINIDNVMSSIFVAGITWVLPYDQRPYQMINVLNEGNIVTAGIKGDSTTSNNVIGPRFSDTIFQSFIQVRNLYVAGLVNLNVGQILNSINTGQLTSTLSAGLKDIHGTANTFAGGISTFNYNLIQNSANMGLLEYTNNNDQAKSFYAASIDLVGSNNSIFGGISIAYTGGIVLGGIVGALGDTTATILEGHKNFGSTTPIAQVIDTSNNGDVYGKAKEYVRTGGIVGVALSVELASGTFNNSSVNIEPGTFTTAVIGDSDPIGQSLISNGLNFGNIYAVTANIGSYADNNGIVQVGNQTQLEDVANVLRPGINASSGGIVGYGLTRMVRMINHGVISSTDVAGGIIGSTYILGGTSQAATPITTVEINTAVHYGQIKAIKTGSYNAQRVFISNDSLYNNFEYVENENFTNSSKYYQLNEYDQFIYYRGNAAESLLIETFQQARRGFGGIFGRLQRGRFGTMRSTEFKNIMNMDSNIDMIGRVDSNIAGSLVFYRFFTGEETYFTAREKDTTPNAFAGWKFNSIAYQFQGATVEFTVRRTSSTVYIVQSARLISGTTNAIDTISKVGMNANGTSTSVVNVTTTTTPLSPGFIIQNNTSTTTNYRVANFGLTSAQYGSISTGSTSTFIVSNYTRTPTIGNISGGTASSPPTNEAYRYPIQWVSDDVNNTDAINIFDQNFPLRRLENTEFIFPVENDALATRFRVGDNEKPNGMYVLSSSTGSIDGATLPTNIIISNLFRVNENLYEYIDLDNVPGSKKIIPSDTLEDSLLFKYQQMYQLSYNIRSEVLAKDETAAAKISELVLYDPNDNSPLLTGGVITRDLINNTGTITYNLSTDAFNALSPNTFYYEVLENELSAGAIIAKSNLTLSDYEQLRVDYQRSLNNILPGFFDDEPSTVRGIYERTSSTNWVGNQVTFTLTVYSEIFVKDYGIGSVGEKYFTEYTVIINKVATSLAMNGMVTLNDIVSNHNPINSSLVISDRTMNAFGNIQVLFTGSSTDVNNLIPSNHQVKVHNIYLDSINANNVIDPDFYAIELIKKGEIASNLNQFGFNIIMSDRLQTGNYVIEYSYYETSAKRSIEFTKIEAGNASIINLEYETFSIDNNNQVFEFDVKNSDFKTFVEFGYLFGTFNSEVTQLTIVPTFNPNAKSYEDDLLFYTLRLGTRDIIFNFKPGPFIRLTDASMTYRFIDLNVVQNDPTLTTEDIGKIQYIVTYNLLLESNLTQVIQHVIQERSPQELLVYRDDNLLTSTNIDVTREALLTRIDIDFNLIDIQLYDQIKVFVDGVLIDGIFDTSPNAVNSVYFGENNNVFNLILTSYFGVGQKIFEFVLEREGIDYRLGILNITKQLGVNAYLLDIRYSLNDTEALLEYPVIRASNSLGEPNQVHDTRIFFDGIDYATAITSNVTHFRVDGKVADIILENYSPRFTIPFGSSIFRYIGTANPEADAYDPSKWTDVLEADYVGFDDSETIVVYMVVSEDQSSRVFYHMTATDIDFNLTLRFLIYFEYTDELGQTHRILANHPDSPIKNSVVLISIRNLKMRSLEPSESDRFLTTGPLVENFPIILDGDIIGINNQSSLFYFVGLADTINYRFGRNSTGIYNFSIVTPKYQGPLTEEMTPGQRYHYEIYMNLFGEPNYYQEKYNLPFFKQVGIDLDGVYYAISAPTSNPISRELVIVIKSSTQDFWWGLHDDYTSWD